MDPDGKWTSTRATLLAAAGQNRWPPAGSYMAATGQDLMAADSLTSPSARGDGWPVGVHRREVCCLLRSRAEGTAVARSSVPARNVVAMVLGTATPRWAPGAATADAKLSLPPTDAQRRRDWSGTVGRGLADAIVAALFDSGDSLAERCR